MCAKKQTATERELLTLLEEAREKVPQIRRYAKGTPQEFLKRVELRSSLLVEAGHQIEGGITVPFYQFRHLTFQEYLSAVAAAEGHYIDYKKSDTVLTPLSEYILAEEWKEVIPMAAVLSRKQAEPLVAALVSDGNRLGAKLGVEGELEEEQVINPRKSTPPVSRLIQCLVEEAEASTETLTASLQLIALFARGCFSPDEWNALLKGPYAEELLHQTWILYSGMKWPDESRIMETYPRFTALRNTASYWQSVDGQSEVKNYLRSDRDEDVVRGLFTVAGLTQARVNRKSIFANFDPYMKDIEQCILRTDSAIWASASRAFGWIYRSCEDAPKPSPKILDRLLELWLSESRNMLKDRAAFALLYVGSLPRSYWIPPLSESQITAIKKNIENKKDPTHHDYRASLLVAFHAKQILPDEDLVVRLNFLAKEFKTQNRTTYLVPIRSMLRQVSKRKEVE